MNKKFEDVIAEQGRLVYTNEGDSMFPIIRARDLLIIEAVREPLKIGDVPLYKRDSGQYVLHRIVAAKKGRYAMKGDNRTFVEKGVTERQIIGVLTGIVRNGKTYPVETLPERNARIAVDVIYLASCSVNEEAPDKSASKTWIWRRSVACRRSICSPLLSPSRLNRSCPCRTPLTKPRKKRSAS